MKMTIGRSRILPFALFVLFGVSHFPLDSVAGSALEAIEYTVTLKTETLECHPDRDSKLIESPTVEVFALRRNNGSGAPCMLAKMGVQAKVDFVTIEDERLTTIINVPPTAVVTGSCDAPQWMKITWTGKHGKLRSIMMRTSHSKSIQEETKEEKGKYSIEEVELRIQMDDLSFPGGLHTGEELAASAISQQLFEAPLNKSFKCKDLSVNLGKYSPMGPIKVSFQNVQFQAYTTLSAFGEGVNCNNSKATDYIAIGIGCFLGATILSALVSYTFCQWWRNRDKGTQ